MAELAGFALGEVSGSGSALHSRPLDCTPVPAWDRLIVTGPVVVLGSTQPRSDVDDVSAASAGVEIARRRSGGGAVWLDPHSTMWFDVTIGRDDSRWDADVGAAFGWLGHLFARSLARFEVDATVHSGRPVDLGWSNLICFGGIGAGEVLVDGRKLVGISQRRTRDRARFQVVFYRTFDAEPLLDVLALSAGSRREAGSALGISAIGCDAIGIDADDLIADLGAEPR